MARSPTQTYRAMFLALAVSLTVAGCGSEGGNRDKPPATDPEPAVNLPAIAPVDRKLDRRGFIHAVWDAASAAASGIDDSNDQRALDGRQFEIHIRFGCAGPEQALKTVALGWSFDDSDRTVRVRAAPTISQEQPDVAKLAPEGTEAVEGFWVPRPWLLDSACPAASAIEPPETDMADEKPDVAGPRPGPKSGQGTLAKAEPDSMIIRKPPKVGIAEFFSATDARTGRRDSRAYENVQILPKGKPVPSQGFNLVLTGRLRALPDMKVIECVRGGRDAAPDCIASATFDRVFIEQPDNGAIIAEWGRN